MSIMDEATSLILPSQEIVERSFTIVRSGLDIGRLDQTAEAARAFDIAPLTPGTSEYFAYALVDPGFANKEGEPKALIDMEQSGTFRVMTIQPELFLPFERNPRRKTNRPIPRIDDLRMTTDQEQGMISKTFTPGLREAVEKNIEALASSKDQFDDLHSCITSLEERIGILQRRIKPNGRHIVSYDGDDTVFNDNADRPDHRDEAITWKEVIASIQLTPGETTWTIGRERDNLETVTQRQGDMVILDNYGQLRVNAPRRNPIHNVVAGPDGRVALMLSFTRANHQKILDFLDEFAIEMGWTPTAQADRIGFKPSWQKASDLRIAERAQTLARELVLAN